METQAVLDELSKWGSHAEVRTQQGVLFHEFTGGTGTRTIRVTVTQSLLPGQHFAGGAVDQLRREYAPRIVALVGIGGSIHPDVHLGDVVVAQEVVHYEPRKVTPQGVHRRGQSHTVTAGMQHALNGFFTAHGEPWALPDSPGHRALRGLVGSGEAVLADVDAEERTYLRQYNEKILAVETEGAGLATAVHGAVGAIGAAHAWLVVRGISDAADARKGDDHHPVASQNAAAVFRSLLPYLL
ncbi:5'-methylthioadenosine/S-adenosylhomocysteine nucleosidase family protein [Streptomyces sp. DSM 118878]